MNAKRQHNPCLYQASEALAFFVCSIGISYRKAENYSVDQAVRWEI